MFYSQTKKIINKNLTFLDTTSVFTGQYWDEFGITSFLVPDRAEVLMLGLSYGGGVRPILSSNKEIKLTCVDNDKVSVKACKDFYRDAFPELIFQTEVADAKEFLMNDSRNFDCIWLDIYEATKYCEYYFDREFFDFLKARLSPGGVLLVNSYGLPNQFNPLSRNCVQTDFYNFLKDNFNHISSLPYRRNITFIASKSEPIIYPVIPHPSLAALDMQTLKFFKCRLAHINSDPIEAINSDATSSVNFKDIDQQMRELWVEVRNEIESQGFKCDDNAQILDLIQNQNNASNLATQLLHDRQELISFLPILCAGESNIRNVDVDWIFDWFCKYSREIKDTFPKFYNQIWLPQLWAMVLQSSKQYRKFYFSMLALMQKEETL